MARLRPCDTNNNIMGPKNKNSQTRSEEEHYNGPTTQCG